MIPNGGDRGFPRILAYLLVESNGPKIVASPDCESS